jgi:hypothetical protein
MKRKIRRKTRKVPHALGSFFFSNQVTGVLIMTAKTTARRNNKTTLITVCMNKKNSTITIAKANALMSDEVRL